MNPQFVATIATFVCAATAAASEVEAPRPAPAAPASAGFQDFVCLAEDRPLVLRLHVFVDGQGYGSAWDERIAAVFDAEDQDGDGTLSPAEQAGLPTPVELEWAGLLGPPQQVPQDPLPAPGDGPLTRGQFATYLTSIGAQPLGIRFDEPARDASLSRAVRSAADQSAFFGWLDHDRDDRLSPAEMEAAHRSLRKLDVNDDEILSTTEMAPAETVPAPGLPAEDRSPAVEERLLVSLSATASDQLAGILLATYGAGRNTSLDAAALGIDAATLARFDDDEDGRLNDAELARFLRDPVPHVELSVRIGATGGQPAVALLQSSEALRPNVQERGGRVMLRLPRTQIEVAVANDAGAEPGSDQAYRQVFARADADGNGYLDRNETRRFRSLRGTFAVLDRDGDGKVFEAGLLAFLSRQDRLAAARTALTIRDEGRALFSPEDVSDGGLTRRKLHDAIQRARSWDTDGDGHVARRDLPRQLRLVFDRGRPHLVREVLQRAPGVESGPQAAASPRPGPAWFHRMDRNADGDLSRREFLGSAGLFRQFDRDGDGLLDPAEASQATPPDGATR